MHNASIGRTLPWVPRMTTITAALVCKGRRTSLISLGFNGVSGYNYANKLSSSRLAF